MSMPPSRNLLAEFKGNNRVMIDAGSYRGDSIQLAMDAGYDLIVSIDIDPACTAFCKSRFPPEVRTGRIYLHTDDTAVNLHKYLQNIQEPAVFWLDAHAQHLENEPEFANPYPLFFELSQIQQHPIKTHTIIIDDILHLTHPDITRMTRQGIEHWLRQINPDYKIQYVANPVKNNILIAHV